ncbi:MAG: ABC transporter substrate-binding protein [Betaproteobacteria bacterium]|nr:ABC transporter substrate-binding protein [Betaproteobacteria bacterium]
MSHTAPRRAWLRGLAFAAAAAAFGTAAPAAAQQTLKFGLAMPLTGSQSSYGKDQVKAAEWAVADINAKGGVNGKKLEMILLDTQADPTVGISAVNRLINVDKVPVFVTAWSAVVKAVAPIANREKVLELSIGANAPEISKLGDYVYTAFPLADVDVTAVADYTFKTLGKKRVAIMYINNDTGVEAARLYRTVFEKAGGQIVAFEAYDPKATDYTGALLKVRAANPEMIHLHGLVADMPLVIAQMRQLGIGQRVTTYAAGYNPQMVEKAGKGAEGLIVTSLAPNEKQNPNVGPYLERWKKAENRIPNGLPYTQYLHDAPYLVAALYSHLEKNKLPASGENMRKALLAVRTFDLPLTGKLTFNEDHTVRKPVNLVTVDNGQFVPLATVE